MNIMLPKLSLEQQDILNKISDNNNVIIDSVAGSGKTTTSLQIAIHNMTKKILLLTYNSRLKLETRTKVANLIKNNMIIQLEVHSYHSFNVKYYNKSNYTDIGIIQTLKRNIKINTKLCYDMVILDEAQDITETFYRFVCKIFTDTCTKDTQICILGDKNQSIFDFNGADNRYLTFANKIFNFNKSSKWTIANLSTSYRITKQMANFVNENMLSYKRLNAIKDNKIVKYMVIDVYNDHMAIFKQIRSFITNGYTYDDIFILAPSVKSTTTPVKSLANYLSIIKNINIYVSMDDNETIDEELLKNKLVITTFHQVKGLERKIVFVTNFDDSYFDYYKKDDNIDRSVCPNEMYVACTRAIDALIVVHHKKRNKIEFLNANKLIQNCNLYYHLFQTEQLKDILVDTKLSHINIMFEINLNCNDYLPKKIFTLLDNLNCVNLMKYTLLPKYEKGDGYIKNISSNIKKYVKLMLDNGLQMDEILIITMSDGLKIITELYNELAKHTKDINKIYTKNISNLESIKVVLYYDFVYGNKTINLIDTFYVKYNNRISSFKILLSKSINDQFVEEILSHNDCCQIIKKLYDYQLTNNVSKQDVSGYITHYDVTTLCKFLPTTIMTNILDLIEYEELFANDGVNTNIKWKEKQKEIYENVCTISGIAMPALFEYYTMGKFTVLDNVQQLIIDYIVLFNGFLGKSNKYGLTEYFKKQKLILNSNYKFSVKLGILINNIKTLNCKIPVPLQTSMGIILLFENFIDSFTYFDKDNNIVGIIGHLLKNTKNAIRIANCKLLIINILKITNLYNCIQNGYFHPLKQIKYYNWIKIGSVKVIMERLLKHVSKNTVFERFHFANNMFNGGVDNSQYYNELSKYGIKGIIDCYDITNNILWEFKCVKEFNSDHYIQLALYAYLVSKCNIIDEKGIDDSINTNDEIYYFDKTCLKNKKVIGVSSSDGSCKLEGRNIISKSQIIYNKSNDKFMNCDDNIKYNDNTGYNLFNIYTGEIYGLVLNNETLKKIVGILIEHRVSSNNKISDEEFMNIINRCKISFN